jgi:hypothetical protein
MAPVRIENRRGQISYVFTKKWYRKYLCTPLPPSPLPPLPPLLLSPLPLTCLHTFFHDCTRTRFFAMEWGGVSRPREHNRLRERQIIVTFPSDVHRFPEYGELDSRGLLILVFVFSGIPAPFSFSSPYDWTKFIFKQRNSDWKMFPFTNVIKHFLNLPRVCAQGARASGASSGGALATHALSYTPRALGRCRRLGTGG